MMGVMALMGITPDEMGRTLMREQSSAITAPHSAVAGSRTMWLDDLSARRAMCGTIRPINPIGPQKAVTTAVSTPERMSNLLRVARMFTPRFSAYLAPKSNAFNGFTSSSESPSAMIINDANIGKRSNVTPEKLPNPHMTKEWTPSWVEKKLSRDIADDAKWLTKMPIINSIIELFTIDENARRVRMIIPAPSSAPARILT